MDKLMVIYKMWLQKWGGGGGGIAADKLHRSNKTRKSTEIKCNLNSLEIKLRKAVEGKRQ